MIGDAVIISPENNGKGLPEGQGKLIVMIRNPFSFFCNAGYNRIPYLSYS